MNRFIVMVVVPLLAFVIAGADLSTPADDGSGAASQNQPTTHKLTIKQVNNKWKVVVSGTTITEVKAKRGDKIEWTAEGTDAYLQFLDTELVGSFTKKVPKGGKLTLPVSSAAKRGVNYYAVFCTATNDYAEGGSPPKIIIE